MTGAGNSGITEKEALSVIQIARHLFVSESAARRLIESGELKAHRVGRQWRVFEQDLHDYLARNVNSQRKRGGS
jgi:excisionase family DNA binding protein